MNDGQSVSKPKLTITMNRVVEMDALIEDVVEHIMPWSRKVFTAARCTSRQDRTKLESMAGGMWRGYAHQRVGNWWNVRVTVPASITILKDELTMCRPCEMKDGCWIAEWQSRSALQAKLEDEAYAASGPDQEAAIRSVVTPTHGEAMAVLQANKSDIGILLGADLWPLLVWPWRAAVDIRRHRGANRPWLELRKRRDDLGSADGVAYICCRCW
jgi:hypothetical protein